MKQLLTLSLLFMLTLTASAQVKTYHVETTSDGNRAVSAFIPFEAKNSEAIFANTLLWTVEHICPQLREGIKEVDVPNKSIKCDWTLASDPNSGSKNKYYCKATFRVLDNKFIFYISDIQIESSILLSKKITPIKRLDPDKKKAHQEMMEDFEQTISSALNELINYIGKHEMSPVKHWTAIGQGEPVNGMTKEEVLMACGRPLLSSESGEETQWKYNGSLYVFFKNGIVNNVLK
ncbi:MAG TPA: hypothetical protein PLN34_06045 [Alloprevotella sp.]|nr:hypothetical protein [Alloprevotella sp.]